MKKWSSSLVLMIALVAGCTPQPSLQPPATPLATRVAPARVAPLPPTPTSLPAPPAILPALSSEGVGPTDFPAGIDPLTGLPVADPSLLERRPLAIKVENIPRADRPQMGLTQADLVYEYYTEEGATRFIAIYYGKDAQQVGPIRSARFFDVNIIQMYKAVFAFGSAYEGVLNRLHNSDFADRLVVEGSHNCPPLCRFDPNGRNFLIANTGQLSVYVSQKGVSNGRQNLDGMFFQAQAPSGGGSVPHIYVRYSGAVYNRWDYDPASGLYTRWVDKQDDVNRNDEVYVQLVDRANQQPIVAENVVVLLVPHEYVIKTATTEVLDMTFSGAGAAYAARDGKLYKLNWQRPAADSVLSLAYPDGRPFPMKPGVTWYEVIGPSSKIQQQGQDWRFTFGIP